MRKEKKGGGFWWGFFLNVIGIIVVACKPDNHHYNFQPSSSSSSTYSSSSLSSGTSASTYSQEISDRNALANGGWKCKKCGRVNPSYLGDCPCGYTKLESERAIEAEKLKEQADAELQKLQKLKSYKELLDAGVISQEEFEAKKKEIL